jgi:hypothetical protein
MSGRRAGFVGAVTGLVYLAAPAAAFVVMFFAGIGSLYMCEWIGLGDVAAMVVTVPAATAIGVGTWLLLLRLFGLSIPS